MLAQFFNEPGREGLDEHALGDLGWGQDEDAVTAVLVMALDPRDGGCAKRMPQSSIQTNPHRDPVRVGLAPVPEPLHVNGDDRPVHCERRHGHVTCLHAT
jgi:hypothetical protein